MAPLIPGPGRVIQAHPGGPGAPPSSPPPDPLRPGPPVPAHRPDPAPPALPGGSLYGLWDAAHPDRAAGVPLAALGAATAALREALAARLGGAAGAVERAVLGRPAGGGIPRAGERVGLSLLPAAGPPGAAAEARRLWVEVPPGCALEPGAVGAALDGLRLPLPGGGEARLWPIEDERALDHHGVGGLARVWRTVSPVALAGDPEAGLRAAVRHAGLGVGLRAARVQRGPWGAGGLPAGDFAAGTRFAPEALWHAELELARPVAGPLRLGDGRFLGLGLLRPAPVEGGVAALEVRGGLQPGADPVGLARALRAAVMARAQAALGPEAPLPAFFHGHAEPGAARGQHLHWAWDPPRGRLLVIAPHRAQGRAALPEERALLRTLDRALDGFGELRAGGAGALRLAPAAVDGELDPLLGRGRRWASVTPYRVDRHLAAASAAEALCADLQRALGAAGLPPAEVELRGLRARPGVGLEGEVELRFAGAVEGPLLLGRSRHLGGGLFARGG